MSALGAGRRRGSGPFVLMCQTVIPVLLAPIVVGENWAPRAGLVARRAGAIAAGGWRLRRQPACWSAGNRVEEHVRRAGRSYQGRALRGRVSARRSPLECPRSRATLARPWRSKARVVGPDVPAPPAVRDVVGAADQRLEHGEPGRGVDQDVRRRHQLRHADGEAERRTRGSWVGGSAALRCSRTGPAHRPRPPTARPPSRPARRRHPNRRRTRARPAVTGRPRAARTAVRRERRSRPD